MMIMEKNKTRWLRKNIGKINLVIVFAVIIISMIFCYSLLKPSKSPQSPYVTDEGYVEKVILDNEVIDVNVIEAEFEEKYSSSGNLFNNKTEDEKKQLKDEYMAARIDSELLEIEAKKENKSVDELLYKEVFSKETPVSEKDVERYLIETELGGSTEGIEPEILELMRGRVRAKLDLLEKADLLEDYLDVLRKDADVE